jgi:formamidopyrimidine-DNA glycosylase
MPELPEVQTVINSIKKELINSKIIRCELFWKNIIYNCNNNDFIQFIENKVINDIYRKGKYIIYELNQGFMVCHLRMTGTLFITKDKRNKNHIQACFTIKSSPNIYLSFKDIRKFGGFYYFEDIRNLYKKIGTDPFDKIFTESWLLKNIKKQQRMIKHLLLDQKFICGLGNIYVDESLWSSMIHPETLSHNINRKKIKALYKSIIIILEDSIKHNGTTIKDFEFNQFDNMKTGTYKNRLKVYNRDKRKCKRCFNIIIKIRVASRGTHICLSCQKK